MINAASDPRIDMFRHPRSWPYNRDYITLQRFVGSIQGFHHLSRFDRSLFISPIRTFLNHSKPFRNAWLTEPPQRHIVEHVGIFAKFGGARRCTCGGSCGACMILSSGARKTSPGSTRPCSGLQRHPWGGPVMRVRNDFAIGNHAVGLLFHSLCSMVQTSGLLMPKYIPIEFRKWVDGGLVQNAAEEQTCRPALDEAAAGPPEKVRTLPKAVHPRKSELIGTRLGQPR